MSLSKALNDMRRATKCKDFLEGVPDAVLAIKGQSNSVDMMLAVLRATFTDATAIRALCDELTAVADELDGKGEYVPRSTMVDRIKALVLSAQRDPDCEVPEEFFRPLLRVLPECCPRCKGEGELEALKRGRPFWMPCFQCNGNGHTLSVKGSQTDETTT